MECVEITERLIREFARWLKRENPKISDATLRDYVNNLKRAVGVKLSGKTDVAKVFEKMGLTKRSYEAFSRFLTFLEKTRDLDELVVKLRKAMPKKPQSKEDTYVPSDSKILEVRDRIKELGEPYTLVYNVLVASGCRGSEAIYLVKNVKRLRAVRLPYGAVRIHLDLQRGSKNEFVVYLPLEVYQQLLGWRGKLPYEDTINKKFLKLGLAVKYFRKWWRQTAKILKIDWETIEAFQGRVSSVGGRNYTRWIPILDGEYKCMLEKVRKFIVI